MLRGAGGPAHSSVPSTVPESIHSPKAWVPLLKITCRFVTYPLAPALTSHLSLTTFPPLYFGAVSNHITLGRSKALLALSSCDEHVFATSMGSEVYHSTPSSQRNTAKTSVPAPVSVGYKGEPLTFIYLYLPSRYGSVILEVCKHCIIAPFVRDMVPVFYPDFRNPYFLKYSRLLETTIHTFRVACFEVVLFSLVKTSLIPKPITQQEIP